MSNQLRYLVDLGNLSKLKVGTLHPLQRFPYKVEGSDFKVSMPICIRNLLVGCNVILLP